MTETNPAPSPDSPPPSQSGESERAARPEPRAGLEEAATVSTPFEDSGRATQSREREFGGVARLKALDADIEKELEEAMGGLSEKELYAEPAAASPAPTGQPGVDDQRKKGRVLAIRGGDVLVDVPGGRSQGVLPASQFPDGPPVVGTEVEFHIEGYDAENGLLLLALQGAAQTADWSSVAVGMIVEARVTATNKGGLAVDVNGIRGFMPISQIDLYRVEDTQQFINQRLRCLVIEVKPSERNLVVSRRALLEKEREENRDKLWQELAEGQVREGVVRSIRDFGAFVDLGGVDGLLHISEMSWTRIKDPSSVVHPGQSVKVVVLKVDRERRKVSLGLKQLTSSPWENIESKYQANSVVKGRVTRLADFGAFVELEPGVEGLIHISELAPQRVRRVAEVVQVEQEVQVMVLSVDPIQRRISLSLKAALSQESESAEPEVTEESPPERHRDIPLRGGIGSE